jgi:hypothetical protein
MSGSAHSYLFRPDTVLVNAPRSKGADLDYLHYAVKVLDMRPGVPEAPRLVSTESHGGLIAQTASAGDEISMNHRKVPGDPIANDFQVRAALRPTDVAVVKFFIDNTSHEQAIAPRRSIHGGDRPRGGPDITEWRVPHGVSQDSAHSSCPIAFLAPRHDVTGRSTT